MAGRAGPGAAVARRRAIRAGGTARRRITGRRSARAVRGRCRPSLVRCRARRTIRGRARSRGDRAASARDRVAGAATTRPAPAVTPLAARIRAIPSWQVTLGFALLALGFLIAAQLARRGAARPVHDPGAVAARRDRAGPADASRTTSRPGSSPSASRSRTSSSRAPAPRRRVKDLNSRLEEARIAAGLIPLTGTGIVLKLEDSTQPVPPGGNEADYLVTARDLRTVVAELWLAGAEAIAINGERITASTAIIDIGGSVLVNAAYLARSVPDLARSARTTCSPSCRPSHGLAGVRPDPARLVRDRHLVGRAGRAVDVPAFAGSVTLRESRIGARRRADRGATVAGGERHVTPTLRDSASQLLARRASRSCSGLLVVVQLRAQTGGSALQRCRPRT